MNAPLRFSRRQFLKTTALLAGFPAIVPASVLGRGERPAPSNRLNCAVIGLGDRGPQLVGALLELPAAQVVAVGDVYRSKGQRERARVEEHYAKAAGGSFRGCAAHQDFREILARADVDAVFIATPEHWHAVMSVAALRAGKDVYCEKALALTVAEGRAMCAAVRRTKRVLQVGTQQRSDRWFRRACEWARNGHLGELQTIEVSVPGGRTLPAAPPTTPPPDLDYDLWLGPSPWSDYNELKCTFNWYFMSDYCAGWIQSWGVHHMDIALWGQPSFLTERFTVEGTGVFPTEGLADTSLHWDVTFTPRKGPRLRFTDEKTRGPVGVTFTGDQGKVFVTRGRIKTEPESLLEVELKDTDERLPVSDHHVKNFLEAIRTRREPVAPVEAGHAATTLTLVADIATRLKRKLTWDMKAERFVHDAEANRRLSRKLRRPWKL